MSAAKPWAGRFDQPTHQLMEEYTESQSYDRALARHDIAGSQAHARMLARQGVLSQNDCDAILGGLDSILQEIEAGEFRWRAELEDVHMNLETRLTELVGEPGKKLHTGRSRNDQVALDFPLFVAERLEEWSRALAGLVFALHSQANAHRDTLLPGYTHLQPAQPVSLAHHLSAYAWMFIRDRDRIQDCLARVRVSPLGAAALAGTTYPLDPESVAREVGFASSFRNSMDAVSDRDFAAEALFCSSRLCEEIILWANPNFGYVKLPDGFSTGSSIMPQKKNPDAAELMRGKTGRVFGSLVSLLTTLKGLPLTYNRDLQEDKEPFFDADRTVFASLRIMAAMLAELEFTPQRMARALKLGFCNATELADYLVGKGVPFREAHHLTGRLVALAEARGVGLEDLALTDFQVVSPLVEADVFAILDYRAAVERRETPGGTGPASVTSQLAALEMWLVDNTL